MGVECTQVYQKQDQKSADDNNSVGHVKKSARVKDGSSLQAPNALARHSPGSVAFTRDNLLYLQRTVGNRAVNRLIQAKLQNGSPGDEYEREADQVAARVLTKSNVAPSESAQQITPLPPAGGMAQGKQDDREASNNGSIDGDHHVEARLNDNGGGSPLPDDVRTFMEPQFGADFSSVRVHTGGDAVQLNRGLHAEAFTSGHNIYFGSGRSPGNDALTAHELTHVIQQTGGARDQSISGSHSTQIGTKRIQCSFTATYPVTQGVFEVDLQTREGAVNTPPTHSGMDGYIRFVPNTTAPNSNQIVFIQIAKATDVAGADVPAASVPAAQAPRGALGQPGLRTQDDPARGIEGGFATDVHHRPNAAAPGVPQGTPLSPRYNFQPAAPGTTGTVGQVAQPAFYGGGIGGVVGQTPGFKRSGDPADIRSAVLYDQPGVADPRVNANLGFESVAKGEDTMVTYGAVNWGFGLRAGRVVNEYLNPVDTQSATFDEALERHRDFYVHEPVTFYFAFDSDTLSATEAAKIDTFVAYLGRNPDVHMSLEGFADIRGGASTYNFDLSLRRAQAVELALLARGIAANRIDGIIIGRGASTSATTDAGTGDQGGNPAVGADQTREANRWANRRVVLTFRHVPAAAAATGP